MVAESVAILRTSPNRRWRPARRTDCLSQPNPRQVFRSLFAALVRLESVGSLLAREGAEGGGKWVRRGAKLGIKTGSRGGTSQSAAALGNNIGRNAGLLPRAGPFTAGATNGVVPLGGRWSDCGDGHPSRIPSAIPDWTDGKIEPTRVRDKSDAALRCSTELLPGIGLAREIPHLLCERTSAELFRTRSTAASRHRSRSLPFYSSSLMPSQDRPFPV